MTTVLVVDDLTDMTTTLQRVLEFHGFKVLTAADGILALRCLRQHSVDLMILDVHLPNMDGLEVLQELHTSNLAPKIIAMSGGGRTADYGILDVAARLGADATLRKPFTMKELLAVVNGFVQA